MTRRKFFSIIAAIPGFSWLINEVSENFVPTPRDIPSMGPFNTEQSVWPGEIQIRPGFIHELLITDEKAKTVSFRLRNENGPGPDPTGCIMVSVMTNGYLYILGLCFCDDYPSRYFKFKMPPGQPRMLLFEHMGYSPNSRATWISKIRTNS